MPDRGAERSLGSPVPEKSALQVFVVRRAARLAGCQARLSRIEQLRCQRLPDGARDLFLHREDIVDLALIAVGPDVARILGVDQIRCDAHASARPTNAALEDDPCLELARDLSNVARDALELEA